MNIENINKVIGILECIDDEDYIQDTFMKVKKERTCGCVLFHTKKLYKRKEKDSNIHSLRELLDIGCDESIYLMSFNRLIEEIATKRGWPTFNELRSERLRTIERLKYLKENFLNKA